MSNQIFDILKQTLSNQVMEQLHSQIGSPNKQKTSFAANSIINTLIGALSNNANNPQQERQIDQVLDRDQGNGSGILDNLLGILTGQVEGNNRANDGLGILMHLLGGRSREAVDMVSKMSGLDRNKVSRLMIMLAPVVLAAVAKAKNQNASAPRQQQRVQNGGLSDLLRNTVQDQARNQNNPTMDLVKKFLDKDGDGKVKEEVTQIGMKILSNLLGRR